MREKRHPFNKKRVARLMQLMGLAVMVPGPNTSRKAPQNPVYPYLLRGVTIEWINQVLYFFRNCLAENGKSENPTEPAFAEDYLM